MKKWIYSALFLSFGLLGHGQIVVSEGVQNALNKAMGKDVELRNQALEREKLELERKSVLNKYIPRVEANGLYGYLNSEGNLDLATKTAPILGLQLFDSNLDTSTEALALHGRITAKAVLFSGGQILNGAKALQYKNEGTAYMMNLRKDEVLQDLILSFDQLEMLKTAETLIEDSDKRLLKESERVEKAIELGLAIPYDRDKIQLARLELESKRTDVQNKQELLVLKIAQLTGMGTEEIKGISHEVAPIVIMQELNTQNRNELKALESFKKASEYAIKKEKGSLLPTLGAFGSYSYTSIFDTDTKIPLNRLNRDIHLKTNHLRLHPSFMVGIALKWEIFNGFERKNKIEEAKMNAAQIENKWVDAREKLDLQLRKNQREYETMLRQIDIAKQREKIAKNNNQLAEKQYRSGLVSITERLAAENEVYKEALNTIETIINERQAAIETYKSAGSLEHFIITQL